MKHLIFLSLIFFYGCGSEEPKLFSGSGGVGVGSGNRYTSYVTSFGFELSANSNLTYNEDENAFYLDNSAFATRQGENVSRLKAQKVSDPYFSGKEINSFHLLEFLKEKESGKTFTRKEFSHYHGFCEESVLAKITKMVCYVPITPASLLVKFEIDLLENSPESYLLPQAMGSVKERD